MSDRPQVAAVTAALAVFDEDGDGLVPRAELKRILGWSFPGSKPLDVREIDRVLALLGGGPVSGMLSVREVAAAFAGAAAAYDEFAALIASVESGAVAPLRGSWLLDLYERGGCLQRRQELPADAFWSAAELRALVDAAMRRFADDPQARAPPRRPPPPKKLARALRS